MGALRDLTGQRFGRWTVCQRAEDGRGQQPRWLCRCECGVEREVLGAHLRSGRSSSCGCLSGELRRGRLTRHGLSQTHPLYPVWQAMRDRCRNPNNRKFKDYGGRGITVCDRWHSFDNFISDMGERPTGTSLDRIDNDGHYEPGNCRWADIYTQRRNQRPRSVSVSGGRSVASCGKRNPTPRTGDGSGQDADQHRGG